MENPRPMPSGWSEDGTIRVNIRGVNEEVTKYRCKAWVSKNVEPPMELVNETPALEDTMFGTECVYEFKKVER